MNESVEVLTEEMFLEEAAPELDSLEVACENKLGFTALCASCPLVTLLGECPKQVLAKADQEFTYEAEQLGTDLYDSEPSFGLTFPPAPVVELEGDRPAIEPVKQTPLPSPIADKLTVKPPVKPVEVDEKIPPVMESQVEQQRQPSYLELLFDDTVPVVVASAFGRPQTSTVNIKKVESVPDEIVVEPPELPWLQIDKPPVKTPKNETPVFEESIQPVSLVTPELVPQQKQNPQPKLQKKPTSLTVTKPLVKKQKIELNPPATFVPEPLPKVTACPTPIVETPRLEIPRPPIMPVESRAVTLSKIRTPELVAPICESTVELVEVVIQDLSVEVKTENVIKKPEPKPLQEIDTESESPEVESLLDESQPQDEVTNKVLSYLEKHLDEQYETPAANITVATPEILTQSIVPLHASILKNIKLLLGSFVLKITL